MIGRIVAATMFAAAIFGLMGCQATEPYASEGGQEFAFSAPKDPPGGGGIGNPGGIGKGKGKPPTSTPTAFPSVSPTPTEHAEPPVQPTQAPVPSPVPTVTPEVTVQPVVAPTVRTIPTPTARVRVSETALATPSPVPTRSSSQISEPESIVDPITSPEPVLESSPAVTPTVTETLRSLPHARTRGIPFEYYSTGRSLRDPIILRALYDDLVICPSDPVEPC